MTGEEFLRLLVRAVDQIEKAGHARRRPNPADRRSSLLDLTGTGRTVLKNAAASLDLELRRHLATLPAGRLTQLARSLHQLVDRANG